MKKKQIIVGLLAAGLITSCTTPTENDATTTEKDSTEMANMEEGHEMEVPEVDPNQTSFGEVKVDTSKAISTAELVKKFEGRKELEATFNAEITEVCSKAGCWINVKNEDQEPFMVRFKDHFTIPISTEIGTYAYLTGKAVQDTVSVEMQQHFLEDAEASQEEIDAITDPKYTMTFIADGIELQR